MMKSYKYKYFSQSSKHCDVCKINNFQSITTCSVRFISGESLIDIRLETTRRAASQFYRY